MPLGNDKHIKARSRIGTALMVSAGAIFALTGCSESKKEIRERSTICSPRTFAVAPILNFSGDFVFEPVKAADLLASELATFEGATVLPVNRVVAYLLSQNKMTVESPAHALEVCEAVGADAIIVAGITEYDAYTPIVGVVVQIYTMPDEGFGGMDPVQAAREARPASVPSMAALQEPAAQFQHVYNSNHESVIKAVKAYADDRDEQAENFGWKQYIKVQTQFLRFCWHDSIEQLLSMQPSQGRLLAGLDEEIAHE